ncbi:uncharacterized protein LOC122083529 [Macadamia integrifolia]|uniref:uncharacterized protein LOC122083529 n=1 Tax=Macadamia integrifolia TaxID=60698 RepID=UPI001C4FC4D1|nr:uncharacterized protein LOC122083529 [Macadamia integrifolia]
MLIAPVQRLQMIFTLRKLSTQNLGKRGSLNSGISLEMGALSLQQLHHLLRPPSSLLIFKPLRVAAASAAFPLPKSIITVQRFVASPPPVSPPRHRFFCISSSSFSAAVSDIGAGTPSSNFLSKEESSNISNSSSEVQLGDDHEGSVIELEAAAYASQNEPIIACANAGKPPTLSVKEKKELASYAHSLGKKLKSQQIGKSGVNSSVAASFLETLEANELLKLKVHNNCPGELADVVRQLEEATGSVTVGQIGRTVILYRPSPTKLKAEEKKKQAQKVFMKKRTTLKPPESKKDQVWRPSNRGRRGSSRI